MGDKKMSNRFYSDVVIIGGGASGIAAAIEIKRMAPDIQVIIAERLDKIGRKLLATGNGRCNLSNRNAFSHSYRGSIRNIDEILSGVPSAEEFFQDLGVLCVSDEQGRMYPYSNSAASVLSALRLRLIDCGVREICNFQLKKIEKTITGFELISDNAVIECKRVIVASGGYASPAFGTDGSVTRIFKEMGYKTAKICPAVAPMKVRSEKLKGLKGVRVKGKISAVSGNKVLREEYGEIQFTDTCISGICVFNLSYLAAEYEGRLLLRADLMPEKSVEEIEQYICCVQSLRYNSTLEELLTGIFVKNLAVYIVKNTLGRPMTDKISTLKYSEIQKLAVNIKSLDFEVTGMSPWQNAQVTAGGIHGNCVDENLQSKTDKGIYFAGEILDVDGDCGGYNLQWAWSSGMWAGRCCAESLKSGGKHGKN